MSDSEKIKNLGAAVIILADRLLRVEQSEKYRRYIRELIGDVGTDICEINKDK